ncbi:MAG: methionine ABC transporter ATP-binding protein [Lachnospiraceae bacterium]|nr:methionine ABC transporter ATP-binding protein [Lachnospiraceae bacterium]
MITIDNVRKTFQDLEVLKGVSLSVNEHEIYGIIGQSGAGKSTLLRCINGLESFDSGEILVDNTHLSSLDRTGLRHIQKRMGMIFQGFNLLERLDVYQNIALPMKFWGKNPNSAEAREKITKLIDLVGLKDKLHAKPKELSGGQKQRVAIARALVLDPELLLCDEATSALDPEITKGILSLLQKINKELGITIIIVTHQMEVVKQICERVAFLSDGSVLKEGRPEELFIKPERDEIRSFLREGSENLPAEGVNIALFFNDDNNTEPVVTEMARTLDTDFSICWAKLEDFRTSVYGSLVINLKEKDRESVCDYLDKKKVLWEVLS